MSDVVGVFICGFILGMYFNKCITALMREWHRQQKRND